MPEASAKKSNVNICKKHKDRPKENQQKCRKWKYKNLQEELWTNLTYKQKYSHHFPKIQKMNKKLQKTVTNKCFLMGKLRKNNIIY